MLTTPTMCVGVREQGHTWVPAHVARAKVGYLRMRQTLRENTQSRRTEQQCICYSYTNFSLWTKLQPTHPSCTATFDRSGIPRSCPARCHRWAACH